MHPDLDRVIRLQKLESGADDARRRIAEHPSQTRALEARVEDAGSAVAAARQRLADNATTRRGEEKDLAVVQARLAKYKDQLLEVKTNREYQAMQHEIVAAEAEVSRHEDRILERMLEADELTRTIKQGEVELAKVQAGARAERDAIAQEDRHLQAEIARISEARDALVAQISRDVLAVFETVAKGRKGIAVAEARAGLCTVCHVRLRPQVFNELLRNAAIIQCDSCQRILYVDKAATASLETPAPETAGA